MFKKNIGPTDRMIRYIVGIIVAGLGLYYQSWWGLLAILPIGTAAVSFCGIYKLFGVSTCPIEASEIKK
jgi:hypothetical protein